MSEAVSGLSMQPVDPLRYRSTNESPYEAAELLFGMIPEGSRVLDVGCGTGSITRRIVTQCKSVVVGIEPDARRAEAARGQGFEVIHGPFDESTTAHLERFDVVVFADVLEHLVDPAAALKDAERLLNPGGIVVASVPNVAHWTVRSRLALGKFDYQATGIMDATHLRWFTKKSLVRLFRETGFDVSKITHSAGAWMPEYRMTVFRLVPWRLRARAIWAVGQMLPGAFACQYVIAARPKN